MSAENQTASSSKKMLWAGWILTILPVLLLTFSGVMKLVNPPDLAENMAKMGWPVGLAIALAVVELGSTLLYVIPPTAVLGAILLTGYMGGAIATHVRIGEPFVMQVIIGVVIWLGIYLRDARLRELLPLRR